MERGGPPTPSSTCSLERKSSGWPALRQHRAIEGSGDKTRQICGRTLLCRFKCAASGRPNWALLDRGASTAGGNRLGDHRGARSSRVPRRRRGSLHSAFARDGRSCAPWPPAVLGAHGATTTSPVGRAKGGRSRWAAAFNRGRDVVPPWTPLTCPLGGERRSGADVEIRRARPPSLPRRLQARHGPDLLRDGPCSGFRRGPFHMVSESGLDADLCRELFAPDICRDG